MKNYAKVGKRTGRPAYRTPALFCYRQYFEIKKAASCSSGLKDLKYKFKNNG